MTDRNNNSKINTGERILMGTASGDEIPLHVGEVIHHSILGEGTLLSINNAGRMTTIRVDFRDKGIRTLLYQVAAKFITEVAQMEAHREAAHNSLRKERETVIPRKSSGPVVKAGTDTLSVCGYQFRFMQILQPECDAAGSVKEFYPELKPEKRLNRNGQPPFCRFSVDADSMPGVYLWMLDDEIIYIGETENLRKRFNSGYGRIYAYNCYSGGRSTNCKMNKVVLELAKQGKYVKLYFYETNNYKTVELELLRQINTKYNVKDN